MNLLAVDMIGSPIDNQFQLSDLGLLVFVLIVLGAIYRQMTALRAAIAEDVRREIAARSEPNPVAVQQPLVVKPEIRMATHEELRGVEGRVERLERQDLERLQLLTDSLGDLNEKSEERASKTHERINLLLTAVGEMRGEIKRLPCSHGQSCPP